MNNFDLKAYMDVTPEIEEAVRTGKPVVALESTILSHGMPYPENLSFGGEDHPRAGRDSRDDGDHRRPSQVRPD